jgi:hypothetical protein
MGSERKLGRFGPDTTKPGMVPGPVEINTHEISYTLSLKLYIVYIKFFQKM